MNKAESGLLGGALITLVIFAYGIKNKMGWKYWVFTLLFLPYAGVMIGVALGKEDPRDVAELERERCRERACKDKGGSYINETCQGKTHFDHSGQLIHNPIIELPVC